MTKLFFLLLLLSTVPFATSASAQANRTLSGVILTRQFELVPNVRIEIETFDKKIETVSDSEGEFSVSIPTEMVSVRFFGNNIQPLTRTFGVEDKTEDIRVKVVFVVPPISENVVIEATTLSPQIETRGESIYENTLFGRDDQLIFTLNAGINAGQHEGGGKSLEIRRFGFNTDHGGVNGGLKILIDNVQQNQGTQGHGQGYLGNLKSLSPELVENVSVINGPFSAAYGDFSGLGVVKIRRREALPDKFTLRLQAGRFDTYRAFVAVSPKIEKVDSFIAYEFSRTDGPFINPLAYRRDNLTANFTYKTDEKQAAGLKLNAGRSDFFSSGQLPLDLVAAGRLDRFGFIDPESGGKVQNGTFGAYYRRELGSGTVLKADAFVGRTLFDLYSNFTFFLTDPLYGDEIQQHDSRLEEGANLQFLKPYKLGGNQSLLTTGANFHFSQINVGLYPTVGRDPKRKFLPGNTGNPDVLLTSARAVVNNYAGYIQNDIDFFNGHLRLGTGLRFDFFTFDVDGFELSDRRTDLVGTESDGKLQPKLSLAWSPLESFPITFYGNYGRGIASQDARGVIRRTDAPKISTTDFYQLGTSYNSRRFSLVFSSFLIDRSNEQVYIPDDGSIEFAGRSRTYGIELRNSARINRFLTFNAGLTRVLEAFFPGQFTDSIPPRRIFIDSAPHTVANANLVLAGFYGFDSSLSWRHISSYRLDGVDDAVRASGHDVVDLSVAKRLRGWIGLNLSIDNLLNKKYFETQNLFESRVMPTSPVVRRIHATPGYPLTISLGVTFRFGDKE